jgi:DNA-binding transcriptional ArsR family regulator
MPDDDLDGVWKALSDNTRRSILDLLRQGPRTTTDIVEAFPHLSRFGVMKHIREAGGGGASRASSRAPGDWKEHRSL